MIFVLLICLPYFAINVFFKPHGMISCGTNIVMTMFQLGSIYLLYIDANMLTANNPILQEKVAQLSVINNCADQYTSVNLPQYLAEINTTAVNIHSYVYAMIWITLLSAFTMTLLSVLCPEPRLVLKPHPMVQL